MNSSGTVGFFPLPLVNWSAPIDINYAEPSHFVYEILMESFKPCWFSFAFCRISGSFPSHLYHQSANSTHSNSAPSIVHFHLLHLFNFHYCITSCLNVNKLSIGVCIQACDQEWRQAGNSDTIVNVTFVKNIHSFIILFLRGLSMNQNQSDSLKIS